MDASFIAEHNDIARMCLKLGHNFLRIQKNVKPNNNERDEKKLEGHKKYENEKNKNLEKNYQRQKNKDNDRLQHIDKETLNLLGDNTQQADSELFQELYNDLHEDPYRETQKCPNKDENIQILLDIQVDPEFQDNNGKEQTMPERDLKLDLKIVFESEEEDHLQKFDENTQALLDKKRKNVEKKTKTKYCKKNELQEIELESNNKKRKLMKEQYSKNVDVDRFKINEGDIEINGGKKQKSKKEIEVKSTKSNKKLKEKIRHKLKRSNIDIEKMGQGKFDLSVYQQVNEKILNNFAISCERSIKPLIDRIYDISRTYFPTECKLEQNYNADIQTNTAIYKGMNKMIHQILNDETLAVSQVVGDKTKYTLNGDKNKILRETKTYQEIKETNQEKSKENDTEECFDLVMLYNNEQINVDEKTQHTVNVLQINYNEEIIEKFKENSLQDVHKNVDHQVQKLDERIKSEIEKQKQSIIEKQKEEDYCLQFCFFKEEENISSAFSVNGSISTAEETSSELLKHKLCNEEQVELNKSSCIQEFFQKYSDDSDVDIETLSDTVDDSEKKMHNDFNVIIKTSETSKEEISVSSVNSSIHTTGENSVKLLKHGLDDEEQIKLNENSFPLEQEDSDVDIETFSDTVEDTERQTQNKTGVYMEMFGGDSSPTSNTSFDESEYCYNFNKLVEINEVIEIVKEYEVGDRINNVVGNQSPTHVKSFLTEQKKHEKIDKDPNGQDEYKKSLSKLETENLNKIKNSNRKTKNLLQSDEIIREKITRELDSQSNDLNVFNGNMELGNSKEQELTNYSSSSYYQVHNEHHKTLFELKTNIQNTQQEFNNVKSKKCKEKNMSDLPKKFYELKLVEKNLSKEFEELNNEVDELETELQYSVQFEERYLNPMSKKEKYDLFGKLYAIHNEQLIKFSESNEWPENCLYPSSTLDLLFEDPNEVKPNVLLFTLFSEDIGYSIKIVMKMNQPPVEIFYSYSNDSILSYVEKGKIPIKLLDTLDLVEPKIFYTGCVIAEIHDHRYGKPGKIYRILLRPNNESMYYDMDKLIEKNSQIEWTYFKKLELERNMLLLSNRVICGDSLPIAGTAVLMQHHFISSRSMCLNPLKNDFNTFESKHMNNDLFNAYKTSDSMDLVDVENAILQEFGFHLKSYNIDILTLIILANTDPLKLSLLICSSVKVKPVTVLKVETQFGPDKLNELITVSLDILRQKISNDIEVIQPLKYDEYTFRTLKLSSTLYDDCINETTHANISKLIDKFMADVCINHLTIENYLENVLESEIDPLNINLVVGSETLSADTQNNGEPYLNLQTDHKNKKSIHFCSTKKMSKNSSKYLDLTNMKLGRDQIVESSPLKSETTLPLSDILYVESLSPDNSSENTETNSDVDLSFASSFISKDSTINLEQEYKYELLPIPTLTYVMSSTPCYLTLVSSTTTTMSSFDENPFSDSDIPNNNISFETSIIDSSIPNNLQFQTSEQTLTTINDYSSDTRLEPAIFTTSEHLEHSINIGDPTIYEFEDFLQTNSSDKMETELSQINEEAIQKMSNLKLD